mgnify:FL=1
MNNKLLFPDFENIIVAGEIPTAIEDGYSYLEQVMALRKYVLSLGKYTKDLTDNVNNNTDDITKLKAFKHITHLGTETNNNFKLEELKDDLYYADTHISIEYKKGFLFYYEKGSLITKTSQTIDKPETGVVHRIMGYGDNIFAFGYNVVVNGEITDSDVSTGSLTEILSKINKNANDISNLNTMITANTNAITSINNILNNSSQIENLTENANLWNLNNGIYKATKNLEITISSDAGVSKEPITRGQIIMVQSSNNDEWEMWYTVGTNIMYSQTYLESGIYEGSRKSINVSNITSKIENLETRVTNLEQAPKDESIFIEFNEGTDTIIPKLQLFVDNFRKGIVTPIYWYYTGGDLLQLSKIVNGLNDVSGRKINLYFTAFEQTTIANKQIPVGYILINVDLSTYNITNINKNWEYQTIGGSETSVPAIDLTLTSSELTEEFKTKIKEMTTKFNSNEPFTSKFTQYTTDPFTASGKSLPCTYILETIYNGTNINTIYFNYRMALAYTPTGSSDSLVRQDILRVSYNYNTNIINLTKYNTSYPTDYTKIIKPATSTTLGGVKIGNGIDVTSDGTISVDNSSAGSTSYVLKVNGALDDSTLFTAENKEVLSKIMTDVYNKKTITASIVKYDTNDLRTHLEQYQLVNLSTNNYLNNIVGLNFISLEMATESDISRQNLIYTEIYIRVDANATPTTYSYKLNNYVNIPTGAIETDKKFSFDFLFTDDTTDSVSSYNSSSYIMTGIYEPFDVNEIYGELMVKYSEVISGTTYSSVCPADRLKYMLTNVSDVDYSFRTLTDGTNQLTLHIRRTDETQAFTSPTGMKIEEIFINGYLLHGIEDISKSTTIEKN